MFVGNYSQAVGLKGGEKGNNLPGCNVLMLQDKLGGSVNVEQLLNRIAGIEAGWVVCTVDAMSGDPTISIHHTDASGKLCGWEILMVNLFEVAAYGVGWLHDLIEYSRRLGLEVEAA